MTIFNQPKVNLKPVLPWRVQSGQPATLEAPMPIGNEQAQGRGLFEASERIGMGISHEAQPRAIYITWDYKRHPSRNG